jgi:hypothetical protein
MQFRDVKKRIQVIAYTGYNREKRRAETRLLGSIDRYDLNPTDELLENLTDVQKIELQSYIDNTRQSRKKSSRQYDARKSDSQIENLTVCLTSDGFVITPDLAERLYRAISGL